MAPGEDESELLARARAGEARAFQHLVELNLPGLWRSACVLCGDAHLAEDLAQETLVEAWRSLARFDGAHRFSSWLHGILRHRFLKALRRGRSRPVLALAASDTPDLPEERGTPAEILLQVEEAGRVRQAVEALPEEHRLVVELRFFAGAALEEIAAALDCPLGTVKSRLHHALEKLRIMKHPVNLSATAREEGAA